MVSLASQSLMIKRRRNTIATVVAWLLAAVLCYSLLMSVNVSKRSPIWEPPKWKCFSDKIPKRASLIITLWTPFNGDSRWNEVLSSMDSQVIAGIDGRNCILSTDKRFHPIADALLFHGRDIDFQALPYYRCSWQHWLFFNLDPPVGRNYGAEWWEKANKMRFNLTMSYTKMADVVYPHGLITLSDSINMANRRVEYFVNSFFHRSSKGIWFAGDYCKTPSGRENLIQKLQSRNIEIEIVGQCYNASVHNLDENTLSAYRFIFAFEDAYCDDYLKEAYKALSVSQSSVHSSFHSDGYVRYGYSYQYGVIPVIFTGANNSLNEYLPPGAYIDASDLTKFDEVVEQLFALSGNYGRPDFIASFYAWQRNFELKPLEHHKIGLEAMCLKLLTQDINSSNQFYSEKSDLRSKLGSCYQSEHPHAVQTLFYYNE